jgi:hypothetical protein
MCVLQVLFQPRLQLATARGAEALEKGLHLLVRSCVNPLVRIDIEGDISVYINTQHPPTVIHSISLGRASRDALRRFLDRPLRSVWHLRSHSRRMWQWMRYGRNM